MKNSNLRNIAKSVLELEILALKSPPVKVGPSFLYVSKVAFSFA